MLIKLGGSVITDKSVPYKARTDIIKRLARGIKNSSSAPIVLAHGSGSFAHTSAQKYGGKKGYKSKWGIAKVARDAMEINRILMDAFIEEGLPVISLRPMSMILTDSGKTKDHLFKVVEEAIKQGLIPVIYGDVIFDEDWKTTIYSGERTLNEIGLYLIKRGYKIDKIIQVGQTDGVYDDNKKTIPLITRRNWGRIKKYLYGLKANDVTGGMRHKIDNAFLMADQGIKTLIINGNKPRELINAFYGKKFHGTLIA